MRAFLWSVLLGVLHAVACWHFPLVGMAALFATVTLALADREEPLFNVRATKEDTSDDDTDGEESPAYSDETEEDTTVANDADAHRDDQTTETAEIAETTETTTDTQREWGGEATAEATAAKIARQAAGRAAWKRRRATRKRSADESLSPKSNSDVIAAWHARKRRKRRIDL
jgi:hypothetical protein